MERLQTIKRRITTTEELHTVVSTMKALAAVNVRLFEKAQDAASGYLAVVRRAFNVLLRSTPALNLPEQTRDEQSAGLIVIGSDQGMCGQFNEHIVQYTGREISRLHETYKHLPTLAVGYRVMGPLRDIGVAPEEEYTLPASVAAVSTLVDDLLGGVDRLRVEHDVEQVYVFNNRQRSKSSYYAVHTSLLPTEREWFDELREAEWPTNQIPMYTIPPERLFALLIEQYLFIRLYSSIAASLAAENASRLNAMQSAEQNVEDRLDELLDAYNRRRQAEITSEMLDIVSGYEALRS